MANPSSTSSKRLVGLGLRGMRNSVQAPPTQVTAQIKSALAQSSPRTSPTVNFTPTGTMSSTTATGTATTTTTTTTPGGLTRTTTTSPSGTSMRTSPSMMTITSFTHPNAAQHIGIGGGGNTSMVMMTRTLTSPVGLKTLGPATTSPTLLATATATTTRTRASSFGAPPSTTFGTPNTSPKMLATAGRVGSVVANGVNVVVGGMEGGNLVVESGGTATIPVGTGAKVDANVRSMKSPYAEFRQTVDGYFGPVKRLEEIVNGISEEMGEGGGQREGEGGSPPHTEEPLAPERPMFFDVPFPLHPEKTFRIHSSPTTVNEFITNGSPNISSRLESTIPERPHHSPMSNASTSPAGKSDQSLSTHNNFNSSPKTSNTPGLHAQSDNFLQRFINSTAIDSPSSPPSAAKSTNPRKLRFSPSPSPSEASYYSPPVHPISSPRSSPGSNYSRMSSGGGGDLTDYRSFSTTTSWPLAAKSKSNFEGQMLVASSPPPPSPSSSLSRWLREGCEENYSMVCSPSSSPLLEGGGGVGVGGRRRGRARAASVASSSSSCASQEGVGLLSCLSVGSLSSRKRSGFNSPAAKIETVLGPRERGIGCIPEKRDYHSLYSRLRSGSMSPGSLTPLEENESMDFNLADEDEAGSPHLNNPAPSPISPSSSLSPSVPTSSSSSSPIPGMPVVTSSDTVVVANAAVGILSGAGTGAPAVSVSAASTAPSAPRLGLRRKSTGVGSPLVNVVATYDSIKNEQAEVDGRGRQVEENKGKEDGDLDYGDMQMSPILMRTKDSLLLKDAQKQKRKNTMDAGVMRGSSMEKSDLGVPASKSAPLVDSGIGWNAISEEVPFLAERERKVRDLRSRDVGEMEPISPPLRSPEWVHAATDYGLGRSRTVSWSPTQVSIPDTPTIGPCTMTMSGSRPVDEAISPLQLSSPILPSAAC